METIPAKRKQKEDPASLACNILRSAEVRLLPADPILIAKELKYEVRSMAAFTGKKADGSSFYLYDEQDEACCIREGERRVILYDEMIPSQDRIRFSLFHELGHLVLNHDEYGDVRDLQPDLREMLEKEANTFARNILCPPPVLEMIRGDLHNPLWARLFCVSDAAWRVRLETLAEDRRYIDRALADKVRIQFREYLMGRRCKKCGAVFTDETRRGRCPECGSGALLWNPAMETREQAARRRRRSSDTAEDLKPRLGSVESPDLTGYWELLRKDYFQAGEQRVRGE